MKRMKHFVASCLLTALVVPSVALAEEPTTAPLATGMVSAGTAEAQVVEAVRHGDILTVKVRFKGLADNLTGQSLYTGIDKDALAKSFYLLVGNKKYLLLTDSNGVPLAPNSVMFSSRAGVPYVGSWYGSFPAPPKDVKEVYLTIENVEPLGPIAITDR